MAKKKPKHLAVVPKSGEKPKVEPPPETMKLPEKAAELIKQLYIQKQQAEQRANQVQRRLVDAVRLVTAALGIDPDSKTEHWEIDPMTGVLTKTSRSS